MRTNTSTSITAALIARRLGRARRAAAQPVPASCVPGGARAHRLRRARAPAGSPRHITLHDEHGPRRRRARLCEGAFLRRVRVRFRLGAGVRAARARLLPEARRSACRSRPPPAPRLLVRPGLDAATMREALIAAIRGVRRGARASLRSTRFSWTRPTARPCERRLAAAARLQFHWRNRGYRDFEHYLEASPPRSARRRAASAGAWPKPASPSTLVRHRARRAAASTKSTTCIATRSCGTATSRI